MIIVPATPKASSEEAIQQLVNLITKDASTLFVVIDGDDSALLLQLGEAQAAKGTSIGLSRLVVHLTKPDIVTDAALATFLQVGPNLVSPGDLAFAIGYKDVVADVIRAGEAVTAGRVWTAFVAAEA
jgi:hypothetical protein